MKGMINLYLMCTFVSDISFKEEDSVGLSPLWHLGKKDVCKIDSRMILFAFIGVCECCAKFADTQKNKILTY